MFRRITSIILALSSLVLAFGLTWGTAAKVYAQASTATLTATRTPTAAVCNPMPPTYYATVTSSKTNVAVGEQIVVTMTSNVGIAAYWISIIDNATGTTQDAANPIFTPTLPGTQQPPAGTYTVQWTLTAVRAGSVTINGTAYGEVQVCSNGSLFWDHGGAGGTAGTVLVGSTPSPTPTIVAGDLGYGTINGKLTNATTGAPIGGATVSCSHTSYTSPSRCTGSVITAADGTYVFPNVFFHDTDTIVVSALAAGYTSQSVVKNGGFTTPNYTLNFALAPTSGQADLTVVSLTEVIYNLPTPTPNAQGCWPSGSYTQTRLRVTVKNIGTADAGTFAVDMNGIVQTVNYLTVGQIAELDYIQITNTNVATVDSTGLVAESNETNNTMTLIKPTPFGTATRTGTPRPPICNATNTPTRTSTVTKTSTRTPTPTGPTPTFTRTPTRTNSPTRTMTPTITLTTPSGNTCSPVSATITAPFTWDGAGVFCWQSSNLGSYINNWNNSSVTINGVNITNVYMASGSYPAKIGGFWYVKYNSTVAWGHFEAK